MTTRPPAHLSARGRALWQRVVAEFVLEPHHLAILGAACEAQDRMAEARAAVKRDGAYVDGRFGLKAHPALAVERDSRLALVRCLGALGLDYEATSARERTRAARAARWQ
ncbi:MAG: P27 family phage terminase small subunit [Candidatus Limnocylindrales bacterium]